MVEWLGENMGLMSILGLVTAITTIWLTIVKITSHAAEKKALEKAEIIQASKEEIASLRKEVEAQFELMDSKLSQVKYNTEKELAHIQEAYETEMQNLSEKIDLLREDLKSQHSQMLALIDRILDR